MLYCLVISSPPRPLTFPLTWHEPFLSKAFKPLFYFLLFSILFLLFLLGKCGSRSKDHLVFLVIMHTMYNYFKRKKFAQLLTYGDVKHEKKKFVKINSIAAGAGLFKHKAFVSFVSLQRSIKFNVKLSHCLYTYSLL